MRLRWLGSLDPGHHHRLRLVTDTLERLSTSERLTLADIGCGDGHLVGAVLPGPLRGRISYLGIEIDPARLRRARSWVPDRRGGSVWLVAGSADGALPIRSETCDAVVCVDVLEHIRDWRRAVREMARLLRPEGVLIVHVPSAVQRRFFRRFRHWSQQDHVRQGLTQSELSEFMTRAGLHVESIRLTFGPVMRLLWEVGELNTIARRLVRLCLAPFVRLASMIERTNPPSSGNGILLVGRNRHNI